MKDDEELQENSVPVEPETPPVVEVVPSFLLQLAQRREGGSDADMSDTEDDTFRSMSASDAADASSSVDTTGYFRSARYPFDGARVRWEGARATRGVIRGDLSAKVKDKSEATALGSTDHDTSRVIFRQRRVIKPPPRRLGRACRARASFQRAFAEVSGGFGHGKENFIPRRLCGTGQRVDLPKVKKESPILKLIAKYKDPATKETEEDPLAFAKELKKLLASM